MRAFGPGSISSFLKTVLDVLYVVLWAAAAALAAAAAGSALAQPFLGPASGAPGGSSEVEAALRRGPALAVAFLAAAVDLAALIVVAQRLRRVFASMTAGDPFDPANIARLRTIGVALVVLQPAGAALNLALTRVWPDAPRTSPSLDVTAWFAVLTVFVLAEVFREGARLRGEARLTV